ncbi:MAG: RpoL/Rpb11 RNA polymerase subunit family protein [Nitrososphaeria archaeon]
MKISVLNKTENSIELMFKNVDFSLLRIVQHALLEDKRVKNISVKRGHPLTKELYLYLLTDGSDPKQVLKEGIGRAREMTKSLKAELEKALS